MLIPLGFLLRLEVLVDRGLVGLGWWPCFLLWSGWTGLLAVGWAQICCMCVPTGALG